MFNRAKQEAQTEAEVDVYADTEFVNTNPQKEKPKLRVVASETAQKSKEFFVGVVSAFREKHKDTGPTQVNNFDRFLDNFRDFGRWEKENAWLEYQEQRNWQIAAQSREMRAALVRETEMAPQMAAEFLGSPGAKARLATEYAREITDLRQRAEAVPLLRVVRTNETIASGSDEQGVEAIVRNEAIENTDEIEVSDDMIVQSLTTDGSDDGIPEAEIVQGVESTNENAADFFQLISEIDTVPKSNLTRLRQEVERGGSVDLFVFADVVGPAIVSVERGESEVKYSRFWKGVHAMSEASGVEVVYPSQGDVLSARDVQHVQVPPGHERPKVGDTIRKVRIPGFVKGETIIRAEIEVGDEEQYLSGV